MADLGQDGYDFDEDGIYREKSLTGIFIDNDGIWCEEGERIGHFTGRDSGLGTNDRKSSSSTLNRLPIDADQEYNDPDEELRHAALRRKRLQDHRQERSLNISEYEESESDSYDQEVVRSREDLNFPELNEDYSDLGSENGHKRSPRNFEYEYESVHSQEFDEVFSSGGDQGAAKSHLPEPDDFSIYLTTSHGPNTLHSELQHEPSIPAGESLFTQDENEDQVQSLREFEQLEQLALGTNREQQVNLIGAYLKGMENQEMMEDPGIQEFRKGRYDEYLDEVDGAIRSTVRSKGRRKLKDPNYYHGDHQLDDSVIENEPPPFGFGESINFSSLDISGHNEMLKASGHSDLVEDDEQPTRIPMLRGRSPSMSRPGSSSSRPRSRPSSRPSSRTGSRSEVKGHNLQGQGQKEKQPQRKSPERRSLPATPQMSDSSRSNSQDRGSRNSSIVRVDRSPDGSYRRSPSTSPNRVLSSTIRGGRGENQQLLSYRRRDRNDDYDEGTRTDDVIHQAAELLLNGGGSQYSQYSETADHNDSAVISENSKHKSGRKTSENANSSAITASLHTSNTPIAKSTPQNKPRQRPFSAEVVRPISKRPSLSNSRPATPNSFRIRSASTPGTTMKPVKALHINDNSIDATRSSTDMEEGEETSGTKSKNELKEKFLCEKNERKMKEQTLKQLQQEYHSLLQKYAEAENTIDSLRIGAKIPIAIELTSVGGQGQGQEQTDRKTSVVSLPANNFGSVVSLASASGLVIHPASKQGSRPPSSIASARNPKVATPLQGQIGQLGQLGQLGQVEGQEVSGGIDAGSARLNLLAGAKAVEEQTEAFKALMREQKLSLDEQEQVLVSVKSGYETLQQNFRDAKEEFLLKKRQRSESTVSSESCFDDDKTIEGELYKLGMKLDELEHGIQENLKEKHVTRKPFQGPAPVKGDHSVGGGSVGSGVNLGRGNRWGSVASSNIGSSSSIAANSGHYQSGSLRGSSSEVAEKLNQVEQEYASLLEGYHRLKQLKRTPERDIHTNDLLDTLRGIFNNAPSELNLPPPPDSPGRGDSPDGSIDDLRNYQQDTAKMETGGNTESDLNSDRTKGYSSSLASSDRRSDKMSARYPGPLSARHSERMTSDRPSGRLSGRLSERLSDRHSEQNSDMTSARLSDRYSRSRPTGLDRVGGHGSGYKNRKPSTQSREDQDSSFDSASESIESAILTGKSSGKSSVPGKSSLQSQSGRRGSAMKRRDTVDSRGDSGFIGSEISRKTLGTPDKSRLHSSLAHSRKGSRGTLLSERSGSVLKKPIASPQKLRTSSREHGTEPSERTAQTRRYSRPKSYDGGTKERKKSDNFSPTRTEGTTTSDEEKSFVSKAPTNRSIKSDQLQSLMDEVDKLKNVLNSKNGNTQSGDSPTTESGVQGAGNNYATPGYYYYVPDGNQTGTENITTTQPGGNASYLSVPHGLNYGAPQEQTYVKVPVTDNQYYDAYDYYPPESSTVYTNYQQPPSDYYEQRRSNRRPRPKSHYESRNGRSRHSSPRRRHNDRGYNSDEDYRIDNLRGFYIPRQSINPTRSYTYLPPSYQNINVPVSTSDANKAACLACKGHGFQSHTAAPVVTTVPAVPVAPVSSTQYTYQPHQSPSQGISNSAPVSGQIPVNALQSNSTLPQNQNQTFLMYETPTQPTNVSFAQPVFQSTQPVIAHSQQAVPQTATVLTSTVPTATPTASLNTSYVPVQVIPANATILKVTKEKGQRSSQTKGQSQGHKSKKKEPRVRYYIKEYKEEPKTTKKTRNTHVSKKSSRSKNFSDSLSEDESESERSEPGLNESLENALETARELKKISRTLKSGLKRELYSAGDVFL